MRERRFWVRAAPPGDDQRRRRNEDSPGMYPQAGHGRTRSVHDHLRPVQRRYRSVEEDVVQNLRDGPRDDARVRTRRGFRTVSFQLSPGHRGRIRRGGTHDGQSGGGRQSILRGRPGRLGHGRKRPVPDPVRRARRAPGPHQHRLRRQVRVFAVQGAGERARRHHPGGRHLPSQHEAQTLRDDRGRDQELVCRIWHERVSADLAHYSVPPGPRRYQRGTCGDVRKDSCRPHQERSTWRL
mmetsp:Transcript_8120/g.16897  ORF Transcript_8120/g.16897 Transcript_8120/m.16897 type:complete len:239 (-) Transcript_8120:252-968(-)